jgi:hypothetical protein
MRLVQERYNRKRLDEERKEQLMTRKEVERNKTERRGGGK